MSYSIASRINLIFYQTLKSKPECWKIDSQGAVSVQTNPIYGTKECKAQFFLNAGLCVILRDKNL
jgi:hypothetical protein